MKIKKVQVAKWAVTTKKTISLISTVTLGYNEHSKQSKMFVISVMRYNCDNNPVIWDQK